jgi:SagB-type dehydrogenase family enzyme
LSLNRRLIAITANRRNPVPNTTHTNGGVLLQAASQPAAGNHDIIKLPPPELDAGKSLMRALKDRRSSREFSDRPLPVFVISDLLWGAFGVNREKSGGRTAPSAHEWHEIDIYLATATGLYLYDARSHALRTISHQDIRLKTGLQPFAGDAPVNLVYVADQSRMAEADDADRILYAAADAGFIGQNVCLYCASAGLANVVRGMVPRHELARLMKLRATQRIMLAHSVGYPASTH